MGRVGFNDALLGADSPKLPLEITVCYFLCVWPLGWVLGRYNLCLQELLAWGKPGEDVPLTEHRVKYSY